MPDIVIGINDITRGYLINPEAIHYSCELPYPSWRLESPPNRESDHSIPAPARIHDERVLVRQRPVPDKTQSPEQPSPHFWFGEEATPNAPDHREISTSVKQGSLRPASLSIGSLDDANATRSPSLLQVLRSAQTPSRCVAGNAGSPSLALYKEYDNRLQFHERHLHFQELPSRCRFTFWLDGLPEPCSGHTSLKDKFRETKPGSWLSHHNPKPTGLDDQDAACQSGDCPSSRGKPQASRRSRHQTKTRPTTASSSLVKGTVMVDELPSVNLGRSLPNEDISKILNTCKPLYPRDNSVGDDTSEILPSELSSPDSQSYGDKEIQTAENVKFCCPPSSKTASNTSRSSEVDRIQPNTSSNRLPESNQDSCRYSQSSSGSSQDCVNDNPPPAPTSNHQYSSDESDQHSTRQTSDSNTDGNPYTPPHSLETSKELPRSLMRDRRSLLYSHPSNSFETAPLHQGVRVDAPTPPLSLKSVLVDGSASEVSLWGSSPFCCRCI